MTKLRLLVAAGSVLALGVAGSAAIAAPPGTYTCSGGTEASPTTIPAGTYDGLKVTGVCAFAPEGVVTIKGDVRVEPGAILNDHAGSPVTTTHITGNVQVGKGAVLGLGTYAEGETHIATVGGNIVAHAPASLYVTRTTVRGNVVSSGGGDPARNFPLKDDTIDGNVVINGWSGLWLGVIRDIVGGNVIVSNTAGTQKGMPPPFDTMLDSTEVATNQIGGNLICHGNTPPAQLGDAVLEGGAKNDVGGNKLGECADL